MTKSQENTTYRSQPFPIKVTKRLHDTDKTTWHRQTQKKDPQKKYCLIVFVRAKHFMNLKNSRILCVDMANIISACGCSKVVILMLFQRMLVTLVLRCTCIFISFLTDCAGQSRPRCYKLFCSTQLSTKFQLLIKTKMLKYIGISCFNLSDNVFIQLINVKMPTIVGILTFMSRIDFIG